MKDFEDEFIDDDGWNELAFAEIGLIELIDDFDRINYEIRNCVRGGYGISGDTVEDLKDDLIQLRERLEDIIEKL
jgi:uncharacterized protein YdcH (DUF465 family)